ncbi:MAG: hypothetical protein OEU92_35120 [Alphaproteobacteria bacterium]|nr:hypothetical protein [Alphaproteobacteria bacterium]
MKTAMMAIGILASSVALAEMPGKHFIENWDLNEDGEVTAEGHSSLQVTMDRYGHLFPSEDHQEAMERIARGLFG